MSDTTTTIGIRILDNEYQVSCPESEADELAAAARDLNQRMTRIREAGKVFGVERIAVMAGTQRPFTTTAVCTGRSAPGIK